MNINLPIELSFKECESLALEVDLNIGLKEMIDLAQKMMLPEGKTLQDYMSAEDYNKIRTYYIDSVGLKVRKFDQLSRMLPILSSGVLLQEQLGKTKSYEEVFNKMAKKQKMQIIGLETMDFQVETIQKIAPEVQAQSILQDLGSEMTQYNEMLNAYLKEDMNALYQMIMEESEIMPGFNETFLISRNQNWIPVIHHQIQQKPTFIAVGAAHLPGDEGVINLLRILGYTVSPVSN